LAKINLFFILISSIGFDLLIGDPKFLLHPVQIIGYLINKISQIFINNTKKKYYLFLGGLITSLISIFLAFSIGKFLEILFFKFPENIYINLIMILGLASCFATKNLILSVKEITNLIKDNNLNDDLKAKIINRVQRIVSRDVSESSFQDLLRSTVESLTENSVDGIFGPLFWIFLGTITIKDSIYIPGPLSLGFAYKTISTLDSMIGYKHSYFKYLGFFSAKFEDYATYIPCRIVLITLPLVSNKIINYPYIIKKSFSEGIKYESPNSGISESIFANIVDIKLGGENKYFNKKVTKPSINASGKNCDLDAIDHIIYLIIKLKILWILIFSLIFFII